MKYKSLLLTSLIINLILVSILFLLTSREEQFIVEESTPETVQYEEVSEDCVEEEDIYRPSTEDVNAIARTLYGECRGIPSTMEKAAVVWVILNRVDAGYADTILEVVSAPNQFVGYNASNPLWDELVALAEDVMIRWHREKMGEIDVGRVLPADYLWFHGDGAKNHFRNQYKGGKKWKWTLANPYED